MTEPSKETEQEILARRQVEALERIASALVDLRNAIVDADGDASTYVTVLGGNQ